MSDASAIISFFLMIVFLAFYFARPRLPIKINRTFLIIIVLDSFIVLFDLFLGSSDVETENLPIAVQVLFLILFLSLYYRFFRFAADLAWMRGHIPEWVVPAVAITVFVAGTITASSLVTGAVYKLDIYGNILHGPLYIPTSCLMFMCVAASVAVTIVNAPYLTTRLLVSMLSYNALLAIGSVVWFFSPDYITINHFCLFSTIIIYLSFENPDLYISDRGSAFNKKAFQDYLSELTCKRTYRVLGFVLRNYTDERGVYGGDQMDQGITLISKYLIKTFPKHNVFYLRNGCFALTGMGDMDREELRKTIYDRFEEPWETFEADLYLNIAFVQVGWKSGIRDVDKLMNHLMIAYYEAEKLADPKNEYIDLDDMTVIDEKVDIKRAVEKALEQDKVEVFLQPIADAASGKIVGAEALARIRDADGRIIPPSMFIPIAEKSGHINALGEQVLKKTCEFMCDKRSDALGLSWINVNLSPIQCMRNDLCDRIMSIVSRFDVQICKLHLEVTEQSVSDYSLLENQLGRLHGFGFMFSLDDYGSGYSNLIRVKHYPFSNIKIDMEIVRDYYKDKDNLLPTMVNAFRQMGYTVTAEGIETDDMASALKAIGCDFLQGYYFSKPLPLEEFLTKYGAGKTV